MANVKKANKTEKYHSRQRGKWDASAHRLTAVCVAAAVFGAATSASANIHAGLRAFNVPWPTAARGAATKLWTDTLNSADCTTNLVTHEMWYGLVGSGATWVEVGFTDGVKGGGQTGCANNAVFWAENKPVAGGGTLYREFYPSFSWSFNTEYFVLIDYTGSTGSSWDVWIGNTKLGTSTNNSAGTTRYLALGAEARTTAAGNQVRGWAYDWLGEDNTGALIQGWGGTENLFSTSPAAQSQFDPNFAWMTEEVINVPF